MSTIDYKVYSVYAITLSGKKKNLTIGLAQKPESITATYNNEFEKKLSIGDSVDSRIGDGKVIITLEYDVGSGCHDWLQKINEVGTAEQRKFAYLKADRGHKDDAIRSVLLTKATSNSNGTNIFTFEGEPSEETTAKKQADILKGYV